jgi:hypothetical protein
MIDHIPNQNIYKCIHELECDSLDRIQEEVMNWVADNTNFLNNSQEKEFWHQIDYKHMAKVCPSLLRFMIKIKIPIREITVGILTENMKSGVVLHNGAPPLNFKINFPIYNTEDVYTEWYDIPEEQVCKLPVITNPWTGTKQYDYTSLHNTVHELYPCLLKYNMHKCPIVFNSFIPHRVMPGPLAKYPRVMLATIPIIDPVNLMLK